MVQLYFIILHSEIYYITFTNILNLTIMYNVQVPTIQDFARNIKRGTFGLYCATFTEKKMNKYPNGTTPAQRKLAQENPYLGKVFTLSVYQNAATGLNYYNIVKNECKREGIDFTDAEFALAFPKEGTYCDAVERALDNIILKHNDYDQEYLRLYQGRRPTKVVYYTIYNYSIVDEESELYADIMRYVPAKKASAKQEALGISNIVEVKQPKIENVVFLAQGNEIYINPRFKAMAMFSLDNINSIFAAK